MKILVTGATGFVGRRLVAELAGKDGVAVVAAVRNELPGLPEAVQPIAGLDVGPDTDWSAALAGVTHVIHLAGVVAETVPETEGDSAYQRVNVDGALNLARQAVAAGVQRFIFISSIGVNGEVSDAPFTVSGEPAPANAYAASKHQAEMGLWKVSNDAAMELVIIRPPLVYGEGVTGKFRQLLQVANKGWVLPLGAIHNQRAYVARDNLVDLIVTCLEHPAAANETFMVSDGEDISTTDLLRRLGEAMGRPAPLLPVPAWLLTFAAGVLGKGGTAQNLCGNLQVDMSHTRDVLAWQPPVRMDEGLRRTAEAFLAESADSGPAIGSGSKLLRLFDVVFSFGGLVVGLPILLVLLLAGYFDTGSPLLRQQRVGRRQRAFTLVKFRTMRLDTASVASHEADVSAITPLGHFMRKTKLDELPQLWNVVKGEMSLVGPRPGLFSQKGLTAARERQGVFAARPGITGLAQVNGIDMATPELLAETDRRMLETLGVGSYFKCIIQTVTGRGSGDAVKEP